MNDSKEIRTFAFVSLGCPKNLVDSERMLGKLAQEGYALVPDAAGADVVVVNTCGFIEPARQESLSVIREMIALKDKGEIGSVVVAGCLVERKKDELLTEAPGIDAMVNVFGREDIAEAVRRAVNQQADQKSIFRPAPVRSLEDTARLRITPRHYAYLKISEGCDRTCTFCAIPGMRGKHVSKPIEEVVREAKELAADGVRELIVVAQDTTYYGLDLYGKTRLDELLREVAKVDGIEWIRLQYLYPIFFSDELIATIAETKKIIPYLDMPLQHISDRVLKRMQRKVRRKEIDELLGKLRSSLPSLAMRTTFLVGFPGETEAEFEELDAFVREQKFERVGVFPYSLEPGTPAVKLDGHMAEELKQERRDRIMETQQAIALGWSQAQVGRTMEAIVDGPDPELPNHWQGRTHADSPEIDCIVRIKGKGLRPGDIANVKIVGADDYDLMGRAIGTVR
ncbi:MAG: 30S ribosomal protein S12 methylthiotransferase RimO [Gemmataceae bacterium]|nr:30S ribosomal protein S12 methylthiotransferase RimO [Gemmataceae bacterium]